MSKDTAAAVITKSDATEVAVQSTAVAGTEVGLVTRNIPGGTQVVSDGGGSLTVDGAVSVSASAVADAGNTTTTPLAGGATFTGAAFDMDLYSSWSTTIFSDQASAANGMKIQWSNDGTNWDFTDQQTFLASSGNMITFGRKAKYVRLVFINGATPQGAFRVASYAQPFAVRQTRKFVGNALVDQDTGQVVVAALQGHTTAGGGGWVDVKVNPSGALTAEVSNAGTFPVQAVCTQGTATNLKAQAESYQGGSAVGAANPLQVSLANHAANATAVKVNIASGGVESGGIASGAIASGAVASGAIASGAVAAGAIASGAAVSGAFADGALVTLGAKADASSTETETGAVTLMQVAKQVSKTAQAMNAKFVAGTNIGTVVLGAGTAEVGKLAAGVAEIGNVKNSGTFAVQVGSIAAGDNNIGNVDIVSGTVTTVSTVTSLTQMNGQAISMGTGVRDAGTQRVTIATNDAVPVTHSALTELGSSLVAVGVDVFTTDVEVGSLIAGVARTADTPADGVVDTNFAPLIFDTTRGALKVEVFDGGDSHTVDNNGTFAVQATCTQGTATSLKAQAECYQGGTAVSAAAPLQVSLANTAANGTAVKVNVASGGVASGAIASGALASGSVADGAMVTVGTKVDNRSAFTDTSSVSAISLLKQISYMLQNPAGIAGDIAHDSTDSGNPVKVGMKAVDAGTLPTTVAVGDRADWIAQRCGVPYVMGGHPNVVTKNFTVTDADGAQTNIDMGGATATFDMVVTWVSITTAMGTANTAVRIGRGATNTPAEDALLVVYNNPSMGPGQNVVIGSGAGIVCVFPDGEEFRITCGDPVGGSISVTFGYYLVGT